MDWLKEARSENKIMKATIKLSKTDVTDVLADYFRSKGHKVSKVTLDVGLEYDAHPGSTVKHPLFKNASVEIDIGSEFQSWKAPKS